ncbi:MAG: hypothetical protein IJP29_02590 [Lachnospiraceae bacterium]|nr:hypothetical protein [Lachnospiraceae bacterium]
MDTKPETSIPWTSHPRPQFKRKQFHILKDNWTLNSQSICIPFPPQSSLSGYQGVVPEELIYECTFSVPKSFREKRVLLHFDAVDQIAEVYVNDTLVGANEGGYLPFTFDITHEVNRYGENTLKVIATDTLDHNYPYGKQTKHPKGMWYTAVSGIWQSVWIENVPDIYVKRIVIKTDLENVTLKLEYNKPVPATDPFEVAYTLSDGIVRTEAFTEGKATFSITNPIHWTPDNPHLYQMTITAGEDHFESYFALRTIGTKSFQGRKRVCLNGEPIFLHGVLDQGYFPDGIYLPKQETGYDRDILAMKELGFNMLRKHIKIEPDYFYYACDRLGMLVMQDMVNSGDYSFIHDTVLPTIGFQKMRESKLPIDNRRRQIFEEQIRHTVEHLHNHPSIIAYTIFNEGWGQFNSDDLYLYVKALDKSRLIDTTSGWFAQQKSDFNSLHIYFRNKTLTNTSSRPLLISECGGYKLLDSSHFFGKKEYGYGTCKDSTELTNRILEMYEKMILPAMKEGVCGCVYTQLSDVEGEINGLYTYDREICKVEKEKMLKIAKRLNQTTNDTLVN